MDIRNFVTNLHQVYKEIEIEFSTFQSGTKMSCPPGCGKCCFNPEIEASVFEMLPFALHLYDSQLAENYLLKLNQEDRDYCLLLDANQKCSFYEMRPSFCRMFGVAGYHNKESKKVLSVCKELKFLHPELIEKINLELAPEFSYGSAKLLALDVGLISPKHKINHALKLALEKVLLYAQYNQL